ncbi:MAG: GNAT family N-acetyltransferase [Promethearchaeota archaeon]
MSQKKSIKVRFAQSSDLDFCIKMEYKHVKEALIKGCIEDELIILAEIGGKTVGYLRIEYIWLIIPYIGLISVIDEYRKQGIGTAMINFLGDFLRKNGFNVLYSSSQVNEPEPQAWHRKIGFEECGYIAGINERGIGEVFFRKNL